MDEREFGLKWEFSGLKQRAIEGEDFLDLQKDVSGAYGDTKLVSRGFNVLYGIIKENVGQVNCHVVIVKGQ